MALTSTTSARPSISPYSASAGTGAFRHQLCPYVLTPTNGSPGSSSNPDPAIGITIPSSKRESRSPEKQTDTETDGREWLVSTVFPSSTQAWPCSPLSPPSPPSKPSGQQGHPCPQAHSSHVPARSLHQHTVITQINCARAACSPAGAPRWGRGASVLGTLEEKGVTSHPPGRVRADGRMQGFLPPSCEQPRPHPNPNSSRATCLESGRTKCWVRLAMRDIL